MYPDFMQTKKILVHHISSFFTHALFGFTSTTPPPPPLHTTGFQDQGLFFGGLLTTGARNWPSGSLGMLVRKPLLVGKHNCRADGANRE